MCVLPFLSVKILVDDDIDREVGHSIKYLVTQSPSEKCKLLYGELIVCQFDTADILFIILVAIIVKWAFISVYLTLKLEWCVQRFIIIIIFYYYFINVIKGYLFHQLAISSKNTNIENEHSELFSMHEKQAKQRVKLTNSPVLPTRGVKNDRKHNQNLSLFFLFYVLGFVKSPITIVVVWDVSIIQRRDC